MAKATVHISKCIQDFQDIGENNDKSVMRSRIFFSLNVGAKTFDGLHVDISQPYGTDYAKELIEVGRPIGYDGPFAHKDFSDEIEGYYRRLVGVGESVISIRMSNNTFISPYTFVLDIDTSTGGGW